MARIPRPTRWLGLCGTAGLVCIAMATLPDRPVYPVTRTVGHFDTYHGVTVADPYRWLEDQASAETRAWIDAQNAVTRRYLDALPRRQEIADRLREVVRYTRFGVPIQEGGRYFFMRDDGVLNQPVLLVADSLVGAPRVLIDPNTFSEDGTVALGPYSVSRDGSKIAYARQTGGSDWQEWSVRDVGTGRDLGTVVKWAKFGGANWDAKGEGFYYLGWDEPKAGEEFEQKNQAPRVMYHRVGTPQAQDKLVFQAPDRPDWFVYPFTNEDGTVLYLSISERGSTNNRIHLLRLDRPDAGWIKLLDADDAQYSPVTLLGDTAYVWTTKDAPRGRMVAIDLARPEPTAWREVIPQTADTLEGVSYVGGEFFATSMRDVVSVVVRYDRDGEPLGEVKPGLGVVRGFAGKSTDKETFFLYTDFTTPPTVYRYDVEKATYEVFQRPEVKVDLGALESRQVFYTSRDGTRVPMFIVHRKGLELTGDHPTILYGYGGFNAPSRPFFSSFTSVWLEQGGVFAVACIRGGGEYGEAWHQSAIKTNRQRAFDDFIAAAEWLTTNGFTRPSRLAINGASNGGLLVGAVMTQRPDLFGVALPDVGVLDMLRFNQFTIGWAWESDYGSPANEDEFRALLAYSPYHNLRSGTRYPATLVTTADTDDRVVPLHSFKFAARLQACQASDGPPVLIRIQTSAGHGAGKPLDKVIEEGADTYAFTLYNLGVTGP